MIAVLDPIADRIATEEEWPLLEVQVTLKGTQHHVKARVRPGSDLNRSDVHFAAWQGRIAIYNGRLFR